MAYIIIKKDRKIGFYYIFLNGYYILNWLDLATNKEYEKKFKNEIDLWNFIKKDLLTDGDLIYSW
jgi:hypothetical protein